MKPRWQPGCGTLPAVRILDRDSTLSGMDRFRAPVFRHRMLQVAADAVLAAIAFYVAFRLRFLDEPGGMPERYQTMLWGSIAFVAIGKSLLFTLLGLHQKW